MARKKSANSKNYFTQETEDYIVKYNGTDDPVEKDRIFREYLYYPFYKLAENIIHTYKFYNTDTDCIEDLKLDIITMLVQEKLKGFDPSRGAKAFSYFGTIVKRWLMAYSNTNYRRRLKQLSLEPYENFKVEDPQEVEVITTYTLSDFIKIWVEEASAMVPDMFPEKKDQEIARSVLKVFQFEKDIKTFSKKNIYSTVREETDCTTPNLTKVVLKLKDCFYLKYNKLLKQGKISR